MLIETSLAIIAATLIILAVILLVTSARSKKTLQLMQKDVHNVTQEATRVLNTIDDFIRKDLHSISNEVNHLINNINALSNDVKDKVNSINFLFRPLNFLNSKLSSETPERHELSHHCETVPQILKWIASSMFLIKTTKEFIKHEK